MKLGFTTLFCAALLVVAGFTFDASAQCGMSANTTNTCTGELAGNNVTTGTRNSFFGRTAGFNVTTGGSNSMFGTQAGFNMVGATRNSYFGSNAGVSSTGNYNSLFGAQAGLNLTTGGFNSFFGDNSGLNNATGSYNSGLGRGAGVTVDGLTFATAIGAGAMASASSTIQLGRAGFDKVRIGQLGTGGTTAVCLNADNELAACPAMMLSDQPQFETKSSDDELKNIIQIQQGQIEMLRNTICDMNPKATVCKM